MAIENQNPVVVAMLVREGADAFRSNEDGETPSDVLDELMDKERHEAWLAESPDEEEIQTAELQREICCEIRRLISKS